mgnify:CR=1 FL=1
MKKSIFFIALLMIVAIGVHPGYCAKRKSVSKADTEKKASESGSVYVFPTDAEKRPFKPARRVLTGIFTEEKQNDAIDEKKKALEANNTIEKKAPVVKVKNEKTIAWRTETGFYYHDPDNNCLNSNEQQWIEDKIEICGLEPCADCFKAQNKVPGFIMKESGNLDLSKANELMANSQFIDWARSHLPIKDISIISSTKLIVYPELELTENGLHQLAKDAQAAYLRHTWRVIEVNAKNKTDDLLYVSSFTKAPSFMGAADEKPRYTDINKVHKDLKTANKGAVRENKNYQKSDRPQNEATKKLSNKYSDMFFDTLKSAGESKSTLPEN